MKIFVLLWMICIALMFSSESHARGSRTSVRVRGYTTRTGKHVPSHRRSSRDSIKENNWSAKGNFNPYTGKEGKK